MANEMDGYKRLAAAVIVQALTDLPIKYRWVEKNLRGKVIQDYQLENAVERARATRFFKSGDYLFWVDVYDGDRIKIYEAYKIQVERTVYVRGKEIVREEVGGKSA